MYCMHIFTRYHIAVVLLYFAILLYVVSALPEVFVYSGTTDWFAYAVLLTSLVVFIAYLRMVNARWVPASSIKGTFIVLGFIAIFSLLEEIFFRGVVQGVFLDALPTFAAVVVSALIFGCAHLCNRMKSFTLQGLNWHLVGLSFLGGIPLGLLFAITDSLLLPTILHALFLLVLKHTHYLNT